MNISKDVRMAAYAVLRLSEAPRFSKLHCCWLFIAHECTARQSSTCHIQGNILPYKLSQIYKPVSLDVAVTIKWITDGRFFLTTQRVGSKIQCISAHNLYLKLATTFSSILAPRYPKLDDKWGRVTNGFHKHKRSLLRRISLRRLFLQFRDGLAQVYRWNLSGRAGQQHAKNQSASSTSCNNAATMNTTALVFGRCAMSCLLNGDEIFGCDRSAFNIESERVSHWPYPVLPHYHEKRENLGMVRFAKLSVPQELAKTFTVMNLERHHENAEHPFLLSSIGKHYISC